MIRRAPQFLALTILLPVTICGSIARAREMFKLLGEKETCARVVGKHIADSIHPWEELPPPARWRTPQRQLIVSRWQRGLQEQQPGDQSN
jgi:hypothetical protein